MSGPSPDVSMPAPESPVRIRVAGRAEVAQGVVEQFSEAGVLIRLPRPPELGIMTLLEFIGPDETVMLRRTACVVFRRASPADTGAVAALEFVDLGPAEDPNRSSLLARFLSLFTRKREDALQEVPVPEGGVEGPVVGVDLGTSTSCAALIVNGRVHVVQSPHGGAIPSVVHFEPGGKRRVGEAARERIALEPTRTVFGSKRFLGRPFTSQEVRRWGHFFPYQMVQGPGGTTAVKIGHELFSLEEVAAEILRNLRRRAESAAGQTVRRAVLTVPAYFTEPQRQAVRRAGHLAGLRVERIVNEPTAAAVAFGFGRGVNNTILVFDMGGGTFDVSILQLANDDMRVLATGGDPFLGGADFDDRLTELALVTYEKNTGVHLRDDYVAVQRIRLGAEKAKIALTQARETMIDVPNATVLDGQTIDFSVRVTRDMYTGIVGDLVDRALVIVDGVLKQAGLQGKDIDEIVLVGGQTRSPVVRERVLERFGDKLSKRLHAEEAVAIGAALVGQAVAKNLPLTLHDVLTESIWMQVQGQPAAMLLSKGAPLPTKTSFIIGAEGHGDDVVVRFYRGEPAEPGQSFIGAVTLDGSAGGSADVSVDEDGLLEVALRGEGPAGPQVKRLKVSLLDV